MIGYEVEIKGLDEQMAKLAKYPQISDKHLLKAMHQSVIAIESAVKPLTPVGVSGRLRNSIAGEVKHLSALSIEGRVGSTLKDEIYPSVMEFGRKPGKMPPPSALERWVHLKMGVPDDEAPGVAYLVARAIGKKGIKGKEFMKKGWEQSKAKVNDYFVTALKNIAEELSIGGR
jgi:hypothetical protein